MATAIKQVFIIYNPNSTGDSKKNANHLREKLRDAGFTNVTLKATEHAGHAEELAAKCAESGKGGDVLVVSSSGDGGLYEVVNGVLNSKNPGAVVGVLPSGNANDHYHSSHHGDTIERIVNGRVRHQDVLHIQTPSWERFAHSYAGVGMTPQIGQELTRHKLNPLVEAWLVFKEYLAIKPVQLKIRGETHKYNNLVCSNTPRMSKYLTLSQTASLTDGKFEVTRTRSSRFGALTRHLLRASRKAIKQAPQREQFVFTCVHNTKIQLDGEVLLCKAGDRIMVSCRHKMLATII